MLPLHSLRGEGKEGRRLQAAPNQGDTQQGRGSKQRSSCSSLKTRQQGPRWRHTPSKDPTTRLIWEARQEIVYKTNFDLHGHLSIGWQLTLFFLFILYFVYFVLFDID